MLKEKKGPKFIEPSHQGLIQKMSQINRTLSDLRFEGKASEGKNLRRAEILLETFANELTADMEYEEKLLFPYLETHLPKIEFMIHVLQEEHEVLKKRLEGLGVALRAFSNVKNGEARVKQLEKIRKKGNYLNYFLHQHTWAEHESVYQVLETGLKHYEKNELKRKSAMFG